MRVVLTLAAVLSFVLPAAAHHCEGPWSGTDASDIDTGVIYIVNDNCEVSCAGFPVFVYQESNGFAGLQRQDEWEDTTCHGMVEPDTLLL